MMGSHLFSRVKRPIWRLDRMTRRTANFVWQLLILQFRQLGLAPRLVCFVEPTFQFRVKGRGDSAKIEYLVGTAVSAALGPCAK